ncbi:MAG: DNA-deoxyinosine glycosylase [Eubacteriales bacterium]|nr:DNA-deoxyinosine glycosylase [Eubacteriales bacterium]MDD3571671.1 DNA-deoxyinosine glycosylase [Eubacteriales bacterium]
MPISHPFPLFIRPDSRILVLGSFPSVRSREEGFYYGHPQNRFWQVLAVLFCEDIPLDTVARVGLLERHRIALWDVVSSCEINGSSDQSIKMAQVNPIAEAIAGHDIRAILLNGGTAARIYEKRADPKPRILALALPSTSAANAAWRLPGLIRTWAVMLDWLAQ